MSATVPYPRDSGKKVVLAGLLDYWADRVGPEHVHFVYVGPPDDRLHEAPAHVYRIPRPRVAEQSCSLAWRTVLTRRHTIQESMLHSRRVRRRLAAVLVSVEADVEVFDTVRLGQYADELPARPGTRRLVYLDDLFSVRYARMRELLRDGDGRPDALGEFRAVIPSPLVPVAESAPVQRVLLAAEQHLVARREVTTAQHRPCLLVNPEEAGRLGRRAGVDDVHSVPPVVGTAPTRRAYRQEPVFVLLGLLSLPHNHDAAMTFLTRVMPGLLARVPDVRVHVVGRGARAEVADAARPYGSHVRLEGYVDDLDGLLSRAAALVAPLRFGSGVKIKVLEALARGLPTLTTSVGAEGIATGPGHGVVAEDDVDRYPDVMRTLADPAYNASLSAAALRHHASTYAPEPAFARYDEVFGVPRDADEPAPDTPGGAGPDRRHAHGTRRARRARTRPARPLRSLGHVTGRRG